MDYRKPFIQAIALFLIFSGSLFSQQLKESTPEDVNISSSRLSSLTTTLQDYVDNGALAGSVVLIARKNKIAYFKAFGLSDIEKNSPMEQNSIFRIASQTKAITSVGIMMLQEEGKLLISDPVSKYLPEFEKTTVAVPDHNGSYKIENAKRKITIRDLLTHTAGIGYGYGLASGLWEEAGVQSWYFANRNEPIKETVSKMSKLPFKAHPGERFVYGYSTDILGVIIESITGKSLEEFITYRILKPLGMKDTHFYLPKEKKDRLTTVYSSTATGLKKAADPGTFIGQGAYLNGPRKSYSGGAGLLSTAKDYANFLTMMMNGGKFSNVQIISPKTVELMTVDHLGDVEFPWADGTGFGLGFSIVEDLGARGVMGSQKEYGWGGAYHSSYWVDPQEELIVVYLTQLIPAKDIDDHDKLRALVYQALND